MRADTVLAIGRMFSGRIGLLPAGALVLFSNYHQFFDRLALGDTIAA